MARKQVGAAPTNASDLVPKSYVDQRALTTSETAPAWKTVLTGTLVTTLQNIVEHWVGSTMQSWSNEWGALRGRQPYPAYVDALVRAIIQTGDNVTTGAGASGGCTVELVDRRGTETTLWGRKWNGGDLVRNNVVMADTYVTTYTDPTADPNYSSLPVGTHIVVREA